MSKAWTINIILGLLMMSSGVMAIVVTPTDTYDSKQDPVNLEAIIPREFDGWKIDSSVMPLMANPDEVGVIHKIYTQMLLRTYIDRQGERVMLSIAYNRNQRAALHVHRPEVCYLASGFDIGKLTKTNVATNIGSIPVMRLVARQGTRNEPITYWIRVGDILTSGWFGQTFASLRYGLRGTLPDGLLFRISTISNDEEASYRIQQAFLNSLLQAVPSKDRHWLVGHLATS
jgi:EpsI family protein